MLLVEGASDLALHADADVITVLHGDTVTQSFVPAPDLPVGATASAALAAPWSAESSNQWEAGAVQDGDPWGWGHVQSADHWHAAPIQAAEDHSSRYIEVPRPAEKDYVGLYVEHLNTMNEIFQSQRWVQTHSIISDVFRMITIM